MKWIYDLYWEHKCSLTLIHKYLVDRKIKPSKYSKKWTIAYVARILKDHRDKYDGCLINDNENGICWERILDKDYLIYPRI